MHHPYVYTIDSPAPRDIVGGMSLGRAMCASLTALTPSCGYQAVYSVTDLQTALSIAHPGTYLAKEFARTSKYPVLLFCMHGSDEGLLLAGGELVSWRQLAEMLQPLNEAIPQGVVACFASCRGAFASRMAWHSDLGKPFFWIVGSDLDVPRNDVAMGFLALVHNWPRRSVAECVEIMKLVSGHGGFRFVIGADARQQYLQMLANEVRWQASLRALSTSPSLGEQ